MSATPELFRALGTLCEAPHPAHARLAQTLGLDGEPDGIDYAEVFLFQAYPYASVYLGNEGMLGGEARDRVAGFWRAMRLTPPPEPDHLAALLGLYATLAESEAAESSPARAALWRESRRALLWEHLLSWLLPYLGTIRALGAPFYAGWAELLGDALRAEAVELGRQELLPLHLRSADELPDADNRGEWVAAILAPARSGMVLLRADLTRAARQTGLGLRMGERAYALDSMLQQDAPTTMAWLADEATRWAERHRAMRDDLGTVADHWTKRAETAAALFQAINGATQEGTRHGGITIQTA